MKSSNSETRGYQRVTQAYADIVRTAMSLATWTLLAFIGLAAAFVAGRLMWSLLMVAWKLIAGI